MTYPLGEQGSCKATESTATYKNAWEAPRWAKVSNFIREAAFKYDLECKLIVDKGILRESGRFSVTGSSDNINKFKRIFGAAIRDYQRSTSDMRL